MNIRNRVKELRTVRAGDLKPNPKNWRTHNDKQRSALRGVLAEIGYAVPAVCRELDDGSLMLLDGHLRAETIPDQLIPVAVLDVTEAEADQLLATIDPLAALAGQDDAAMAALHAKVKFDSDAVNEMLQALQAPLVEQLPTAGQTDPDSVPEVFAESYVQAGDIWQLGQHRIMCGSSTLPADVDVLMGVERADIVWTDPPWNVAYGTLTHDGRVPKHAAIENDDLGEAFPGFCTAFCAEIQRVVKPGAMLYMAMGSQEWPVIDAALRAAGFHWSSTIIWTKDSLVLSRKDYHTQYEPIWYGWQGDVPRLAPLEDRKQSDVWPIPRPKKSDEHPTMKPVELVTRALQNSSRPGALVFEPFSGSGTVIIAGEQTGRRVRAMEMVPKYVQVAIKRWEEFTGLKAIKLELDTGVQELRS